jgi:hypothetical protein
MVQIRARVVLASETRAIGLEWFVAIAVFRLVDANLLSSPVAAVNERVSQ